MVQEIELVTLVTGIGVFVFVVLNHASARRVPSWGVLLAAFGLSFAAWVLTVLEGFAFLHIFNALEHLSYIASSCLIALWLYRAAGAKGEKGP